VQTHLVYTAIKLGPEKRTKLEEHLLNHTAFVGSKLLGKHIFKEPVSSKKVIIVMFLTQCVVFSALELSYQFWYQKKTHSVKLVRLVGDQMETILQIIEECLLGLAHKEDILCWKAHIEMVELLRQSSFTNAGLAMLQGAVDHFKTEFHRVHINVSDTITIRKDGTVTKKDKPLNLQFPNFGALEHWPEQIRYLGPPCLQSTKVWEHRHLDSKRCSHNTNQKEYERDTMLQVYITITLQV